MKRHSLLSQPLHIRLAIGLPLSFLGAFLLTGCGRENIQTYNIPKEQMTMANPHGEGEHGHSHGGAASLPQLQYQAQPGWEAMQMGGMRAANFTTTGQNGQKAEISAMALPGATAPVRDILNMWREQVKLEPASEADLPKLGEKVQIGSAQGELYDMTSPEPLIDNKFKARTLAALLKQDQTIWVFKMMGEAEVVAEQKPAFLAFLKSVRFAEPAPASAPEMASSSPMPPANPGMAAAPESPKKPAWQAPANWKEQPPSQMLIAKFVIPGDDKAQAELTVSAFPGDVGGLLANVNRWRGQLSLGPIQQNELAQQTSTFDVMGGTATLVEINGTNARTGQKARLLGAVVPRGELTWFYKLLGDEQVVTREKEPFVKFVQSVRYPSNTASAAGNP